MNAIFFLDLMSLLHIYIQAKLIGYFKGNIEKYGLKKLTLVLVLFSSILLLLTSSVKQHVAASYAMR